MLLKELCELNGASGIEKPVRETLKRLVASYVDSITVDNIGNLLAKKEAQPNSPRVMIAAHMDEVGLMVTDITADGLLKFQAVGGIDARVLIAKHVRVGDGLSGVIGCKAVHLQKDHERNKALQLDQLYIDIGAKSREDALKHVKPGDYAHFVTELESLGEGFLKAKAFDDRVGCAALAELLQNSYELCVVGAFTVQEEVGLRGAQVAAYHVEPDFAIVLEGTISAEMLDVEEHHWVTQLGQGPVCSIMDNATLYSPRLVRMVAEVAKDQGIPLQFRRSSSGGNDAGRIHLTKAGIPTIALSVPCRYIHSPVSIIAERDFRNLIRLADAILKALPQQLPRVLPARMDA